MKMTSAGNPSPKLIMTAAESEDEAHRLAEGLVTGKLAACVQIAAVASVYTWREQIEKTPEFLLLIKTTAERAAEAQAYITANHSYEVPEITQIDIDSASPAYLAWMLGATGAEQT